MMMKRIWRHYTDWEEIDAGMWVPVRAGKERTILVRRAIAFTGNAERYGEAMLRVVREWPNSCEHNLTDLSQNRKAWIGHAAACLEIGVSEDVTREAWRHLSDDQRDAANAKATEAILAWENVHVHKQGRLFLLVR